MNKVILIGRPTADPDVRYTQKEDGTQMAIGRFTLAVDRKGKDAGTDFIKCVGFGKQGEFAEKYIRKGEQIAVEGRIQTGSYTNKDGQKVYTTDVIVEGYDFCSSRSTENREPEQPKASPDFVDVPEGIEEDLPFK